MNISELFIRRSVFTVLLTVSCVLFGFVCYQSLPVSDLPTVDYPVIQVSASYPGASPETMANNIASPLEKQFMQIAGLALVTSQNAQGSTSITLQFDLDKNIDTAVADVQSAINAASSSLPIDIPSQPTLKKSNPNDQAIIFIAIASATLTSTQLYDYAYTTVGQQITILPGVSSISVFGTKSAVRVEVDLSKVASRGLTISDVVSDLQTQTQYPGAGQLDGRHQTLLLLPEGQLSTAEEYSKIILANASDGTPIYLRDIATVEDAKQDERIHQSIWSRGLTGKTNLVVTAVYRRAGANAIEVAKSVRTLLDRMKPELPASVQTFVVHDRSETITNSVNDVKQTLYIGFALVVAVVFAFLGRVKDTIIPMVAIPLSLFITFICMSCLGYSLDNLSLMALTLAVGFLVDDAIVFLENVVRLMEYGDSAFAAAIKSGKQITFTIMSMTVSLAIVFLPLLLLPGLMGRIFREFSVVIIIAILASGLVSITLTPLMCSRLLTNHASRRKTGVEQKINASIAGIAERYHRSLDWFFEHRWVSLIVWGACMAGTMLCFESLSKTFLPVGDSGFIRGIFMTQEGASPEQMRVYQAKVDKVLDSNPAVQTSLTVSGISRTLPSSQAFVIAFLRPRSERKDIQTVSQELSRAAGNIPGIVTLLRPNPTLEISTGATSTNQGQYAYTLSGIDTASVYSATTKLVGKLRTMSDFASVSTDLMLNTPTLRINMRRERAEALGVTIQAIETAVKNSYAQNYVYLIKKPQDQYQVIVEAREETRRMAEDLSKIYVKNSAGTAVVPLSAVAELKQTIGPQLVNHTDQLTSASIFFDLKPGVAIGDAIQHVEQAAQETLPSGVTSKLQGEADTFAQTLSSLIPMAFVAVFAMYVILGMLYQSYIHPVTILSSLPVALVGGLATLIIFNQQLSLYADIGIFMLMGIVKKNGILLIDFALQRQREGLSALEAAREACLERFRPIIMTTLAALGGAIPVALGYGADGESRRALGLIIVGGLVVSQFITLYITPVIFLYLEKLRRRGGDDHDPGLDLDQSSPVLPNG